LHQQLHILSVGSDHPAADFCSRHSRFAGIGFVYPFSFYAIAAGVLQAAIYFAYLRALRVEEASRVTSLIFIYPLFVFAGSALFLGDLLTPGDYLGGTLLVVSALLVSSRPGEYNVVFSPALKPLFFFWIFAALFAIVVKYISTFMNEWHIFIWISFGTLIAVLPLALDRATRNEVLGFFEMGRPIAGPILLQEIFDFLGRLFSIIAYSAGPVALVAAVGALQPSITLAYILVLGLYLPGLLKEELDQKTLALKFLAGILVVAGIYLIS
jgi:hypothetical protein